MGIGSGLLRKVCTIKGNLKCLSVLKIMKPGFTGLSNRQREVVADYSIAFDFSLVTAALTIGNRNAIADKTQPFVVVPRSQQTFATAGS